MKAYKNSDGVIEWFNFDIDNIYYYWGNQYHYSNVTWNSDGSV